MSTNNATQDRGGRMAAAMLRPGRDGGRYLDLIYPTGKVTHYIPRQSYRMLCEAIKEGTGYGSD